MNRKKISYNKEISLFEVNLETQLKHSQTIKDIIDNTDDAFHNTTNLRAKVTPFNMYDKNGFEQLAKHFVFYCRLATKLCYNVFLEHHVNSMWGAKYKKGDWAASHDHFPATWACVYYLNDSDPIYFTEVDLEIKPKAGTLLIFPGDFKHEVKTCYTDRYIVSANVKADYDS